MRSDTPVIARQTPRVIIILGAYVWEGGRQPVGIMVGAILPRYSAK